MGASNAPETMILRARTLLTGTVLSTTPPSGYIEYPEGEIDAGTDLALARSSTGVYVLTFPRNYSEQETQVWVNVTDGVLAVVKKTYTNTLGGVAPTFNVVTFDTYSVVDGTTHVECGLEIRVVGARVSQATG